MPIPRAIALIVCLALPALAWRLGGLGLWYVNAFGYLLAAAVALRSLARDDELKAAMVPRAGDTTLAGLTAAALFVPLWFGTVNVIAPDLADFPDPRVLRYCRLDGVWLPRPDMHGVHAAIEWLRDQSCAAYGHGSALRGPARGALVVFIAAAEEIAWRGGVQQHLSERFGSQRGYVLASLLYALCQLGTGNVSIALVALPAGFLWGAIYRFRGRLAPAILSHALFSWLFFYQVSPLAMHR